MNALKLSKLKDLNVLYAHDEIFDIIEHTDFDPKKYPYVLIPNILGSRTADFVSNPSMLRKETYGYIDNVNANSPTNFCLISFHRQDGSDSIPVDEIGKNTLDSLNDGFNKMKDVSDVFKVDLNNVSTKCENSFSLLRAIDNHSNKTNSNNLLCTSYPSGVLKLNEYYISQAYNMFVNNLENKYENTILFDPREQFSYMFDANLSKELQKDIANESVKVSEINSIETYNDVDIRKAFFSHVLLCNDIDTLAFYSDYLYDNHNMDSTIAIHSSVDDPVTNYLVELRNTQKNIPITYDNLFPENNKLCVEFSWDAVIENDMIDTILKEIDEGGIVPECNFNQTVTHENYDYCRYFINNNSFLGKIKLKTIWMDCIEGIVINKDSCYNE